jgi:hypothetical protein
MPIREFLRGGYQTLTESTLVMKHGHPMFTVIPQKKTVKSESTFVTSDPVEMKSKG